MTTANAHAETETHFGRNPEDGPLTANHQTIHVDVAGATPTPASSPAPTPTPANVGTAEAPHSGVEPQGGAAFDPRTPHHTPLVDIHDGPDGLVLEADLPGASGDGVSIRLEDNVLTLHAKGPAPGLPDGARLLHEEYREADYYRSFILSDEVERESITAAFKNGVLRLHLPKAERARTRRIEITS